jgi:hypothetical protein
MSDDLFRIGRSNLLPYGVVFDAEANASTIVDRLFRPIVCCPGKWPKCKMELATVSDAPAMFGAKLLHQFFREHAQPSADPAVRRRIRTLVNSSTAMKAELRRRGEAIDTDDGPPPTKARSHADLIHHTFGEAAA